MGTWSGTKILVWTLAFLAGNASMSVVRAEQPEEPRDGDGSGENFIDIPGFGRLKTPPGILGLRPQDPSWSSGDEDESETNSASGKFPKSLAQPPAPAKPAPRQTPREARAEALNALFQRLEEASDPIEAQAIASKISELFANTSSDTLALLGSRATAAEMANAQQIAEALLDDVVALDPTWSEGFVRRARSRIARGDLEGAIDDLRTAIQLEPRRFDALAAIGALKEQAGDKKAALEAYRRALALNPMQEEWRKSEERLRFDVEGRDI